MRSLSSAQNRLAPRSIHFLFPVYLDVLHVLEEVRLGVVVVGELHQLPELGLGGEGLHQAGQDGGVLVTHRLKGVRRHREG